MGTFLMIMFVYIILYFVISTKYHKSKGEPWHRDGWEAYREIKSQTLSQQERDEFQQHRHEEVNRIQEEEALKRINQIFEEEAKQKEYNKLSNRAKRYIHYQKSQFKGERAYSEGVGNNSI